MTAAAAATEQAPAATSAPVLLRPRVAAGTAQPLLLLANGNASGVLRRRELVDGLRELLRINGTRVETLLTESTDELAALLPRDPERRVALVGGDGSIHAAANLPGLLPELALIPAGSANNIARSLGIPTDARAAASVAVNGVARRLDLIEARAGDRRYLAVEGVSVGFLALARARYRSRNSADVSAAIASGVGALARFRPLCAGLESDGAAQVIRISQLFAANLPRYGFGLHVTPDADAADGFLDLVAIEGAGRALAAGDARAASAGKPPPTPRRSSLAGTAGAHRDGRPLACHRRLDEPWLRADRPRGPARSAQLGGAAAMSVSAHPLASASERVARRAPSVAAVGLASLAAFAVAALGAGLGRAVTTSYLPVLLDRIAEAPGLIGTVMLVNAVAGFAVPLVVGFWSDRRRASGRGRTMPFIPRRQPPRCPRPRGGGVGERELVPRSGRLRRHRLRRAQRSDDGAPGARPRELLAR